MLADITIENLGAIPRAAAEFSPGLTVLTGETGAGKTMVVTGLRLLAGGRADASRIRTGQKRAGVEGRFSREGMPESVAAAADAVVAEAGGRDDENGDWLASRTVSVTADGAGRSRAHLGGRSVPAGTLADFASGVLAIHGQHDQLRLLSADEQLAALDRFDPAIAPLAEAYARAYREHRRLAKDLAERTGKRRELAQEVDRLRFALDEIDKVAPQSGEDDELIAQIRRLQDVDVLRESASGALGLIDGAEALGGYDDSSAEPAAVALGRAASTLTGSGDEKLVALGRRLAAVTTELSEVSAELGGYLGELDADPEALEHALLRQQELKTLTRKYAPDAAGVLAWRDKAAARLERIDVSSDAVENLTAAVKAAGKELDDAARALTDARTSAASGLGEAVSAELAGLAMGDARLTVEVRPATPGPRGADEVELMLAPAADAAARPLAQSASGGELSRVMLALEVILAGESGGTTLVFDEVDSGVGGHAAAEIGRRLARLSRSHQVIVVTHLPQVAAYADTHLHVEKATADSSEVTTLTGERRVAELARMLAGLADTDTGRAHAAELLERAQAEVAAMGD